MTSSWFYRQKKRLKVKNFLKMGFKNDKVIFFGTFIFLKISHMLKFNNYLYFFSINF